MKVIKAGLDHIPILAALLDQYPVFYKQDSYIAAAKKFLEERLSKNESTIFLALLDDEPIGFTQLYVSFSSVSLQPVYILNDLYVASHHRKKGVGEQLLNRAKNSATNKTTRDWD